MGQVWVLVIFLLLSISLFSFDAAGSSLNLTIEYPNSTYCSYQNDTTPPEISHIRPSSSVITPNANITLETDAHDTESGLLSCVFQLYFTNGTFVMQSGSNNGPQYYPQAGFPADCKGTVFFLDSSPPGFGYGQYIIRVNVTNNRTCSHSSTIAETMITYGYNDTNCIESWTCGSWSGCISGLQTRTCYDINNCGTELAKPALSQACIQEQQAQDQGSGSSGGGGGISGGTAPNPNTARHDYQIISKQGVTWSLDYKNIPITALKIVPAEDAKNVIIRIEVMEENITESGIVYSYIRISHENINDFKDIGISFRVENNWLEDNKVDEISLMRFSDNAWTTLGTKETSHDSTYRYFTAVSPGLSDFAIIGRTTGQKGFKNENTEPGQENDKTGVTGNIIRESVKNSTDNSTDINNMQGKNWLGIIVIFIMLAIGIIIGIFVKRSD